MPFEAFKYRMLMWILDMAGQGISGWLTKPDYDEQEQKLAEYYENAKNIARQAEKQQTKKKPMQTETPPPTIPIETKDLTSEKIEGGIACLPCSTDHFSTVSGALNEALRFARKEGITHSEVMRRLGVCKDELNIMERLDLSAENIVQLKGEEKQLAEWGLNKSREIRHKITAIQTPEDLERVAAEVAKIRTKFMKEVWDIATVDGSIEKLCKGLKDEDRERCMNTINAVLNGKKERPP